MNSIFEKLGGTKMSLSILAILVGAAIELLTPRGVSPSFAGLLAGIVAAYGAANAVITNRTSSLEAESPSESSQVESLQVAEKLASQEADIQALKSTITSLGEFAKNTHKLVISVAKN